jgi:hypothetical protein
MYGLRQATVCSWGRLDSGAVILVNEEEQKTTNADQDRRTTLIAKKAGKKISRRQTASPNPNGTISEGLSVARM